MKTTLSLMIALGLLSHSALAQEQMPQASPGSSSTPVTDIAGPSSTPAPAESSTDLSSGASDAMRSEAGAELQQQDTSPIARLKPVTQDDVTYLCGGVGQEEVAHMKEEAKGYDLMLTFAARDGSYLADVDVDIKDAKGNSVLQTACDSPILLVDLPRGGTYRVRAETAGYELNKTVKVSAGEKKQKHVAAAVLSWPQHVAEAAAAATTSTGSSGSAGTGESGAGTDSSNTPEGSDATDGFHSDEESGSRGSESSTR